ncbi:MAG TPA: IS3 family transposase [Nitrospirales bacterium]|nr:IS3 family transposase [Nitrospirales bacterium]
MVSAEVLGDLGAPPGIDVIGARINRRCASGFDLAHARPRFGYLRIWVLLRREGWLVNWKRVRRRYRLEGLQLRIRVRRRKPIEWHRGPAPTSMGPTERWSMDFVHDTLAD